MITSKQLTYIKNHVDSLLKEEKRLLKQKEKMNEVVFSENASNHRKQQVQANYNHDRMMWLQDKDALESWFAEQGFEKGRGSYSTSAFNNYGGRHD